MATGSSADPPAALPDYVVKAPRRVRGQPGKHQAGGGADDGGRRGRGSRGAKRNSVRAQGKESQVRELQRLTITGGSARGRRIVTPGVYLRPMMSRVREALFSILYPTGVLRDSASHLDLFAGAAARGGGHTHARALPRDHTHFTRCPGVGEHANAREKARARASKLCPTLAYLGKLPLT